MRSLRSVRSLPVQSLLLTFLLCMAEGALHAQHIVTRRVIAGGGGTSGSGSHTLQGTVSQGAAARLTSTGGKRHDVGFWYTPVSPEVTTIVSLPHTEAEVDTRLTLPLHLTVGQAQIPFLPRAFHARIRYNHTLLRPVGSTPGCTYADNDCLLEIDGMATEEDGVIASLEFIAVLGDSERTALTIEDFTWERQGEERIATLREHGLFELLGICRVGGEIRLIHSGTFASRVAAWPNPAHDHVALEYVAAESGPVEIKLLDPLGREVAQLVQADVEAQRLYRIEVDLARVPSGAYVLTYTTPTRRLTQPLLIAQ